MAIKEIKVYVPASLPQDLNCAICLNPMTNAVNIDPCNHKFHPDCIKQWINTNQVNESSKCPICRVEIKTAKTDHIFQNIVRWLIGETDEDKDSVTYDIEMPKQEVHEDQNPIEDPEQPSCEDDVGDSQEELLTTDTGKQLHIPEVTKMMHSAIRTAGHFAAVGGCTPGATGGIFFGVTGLTCHSTPLCVASVVSCVGFPLICGLGGCFVGCIESCKKERYFKQKG